MAVGSAVPLITQTQLGQLPPASTAIHVPNAWVTVCDAPETADNGGSHVVNPSGITRSALSIFDTKGLGAAILLRLKYDDGLTNITDPVVQVFGSAVAPSGQVQTNENGLGGYHLTELGTPTDWQPLFDRNGTHAITLTTAASTDQADSTGTFLYTVPVEVDLAGCRWVLVTVKTALAATGTVNTSTIDVKLTGRMVNPPTSISATVTADTEFPAAAALANNASNPTTTKVGSCTLVYDGSGWDLCPGDSTNGIKSQPATGGSGAVDATTARVIHATDDPAVTSLAVIDDWDESDRAKVNPIVGQAGIAAGAGAVGATVPRVTLASDDPAVALLGGTGALKDNGPAWTSVFGVSSAAVVSADITTATAVTSAPTSGQKLVITDIVVSTDTAMNILFEEETSGTDIFKVFLPANGTLQITPRSKVKLATADKKLTAKASVAGNVGITVSYYSEA